MEYLSRYLSTNKAMSLICCVFWIFSPAEGDIISEVAGSRVSMHCNNNSINTLQQLTWKLNEVTLISFKPPNETYVNEKANSLNINMFKSESQLYALIIESLQKSHIGNYTCDTATETGTWKQTWELIVITEHKEAENWNKLVIIVIITCTCCLIFIFALAILRRVYNPCARNSSQAPTAEMEETEDIYENCLETNRSRQHRHCQPHHYKPRAY
ncbi:uncharacterized protein AKAME5_001892200 [Lates japonicus]|uniref:Ig-like domain-containing protein n=1 Tax=Lates japonicus TaxID=270547 RepID=A0AAD3N8X1_LATJO|nr:uncharacterized protein AKAME5_001892200 [Lates japonicus]